MRDSTITDAGKGLFATVGLRAGAFVRLPKLSALRCFVQLLGEMGLQARGPVACDDSVWDISNAARLGKTEVPPQSRVSGKCY